MALILDPLDELPDLLAHLEDVLRFVEVDDDATATVLDAAAEAAGSLGLALRRARSVAPTLVAADGVHELGVVLSCPEARQYLPAILDGVAAVPADELARRVPEAGAGLARLRRCVPYEDAPHLAAGDGAAPLGTAGRGVIVSTPTMAAVAADQAVLLARWPSAPGARVVLSEAEEAAYHRLVAVVVDDPLERFAAD